MSFDQIEDDIWIIPSEAMKGRRDKGDDFRVPLTQQILDLIEISRLQNETGNLAFRTPRRMKQGEAPATDQSVENVMRKFERDWNWDQPYRPHGLRATFRTWAGKENPAIYIECIARGAKTAAGHHENLDPFLDTKTGNWGGYQHLLTHG